MGIFDPVEIDGCFVSRATLHNLTFIKELELVPGCRISVSKRNMIIPHIEENLERGHYVDVYKRQVIPCEAELLSDWVPDFRYFRINSFGRLPLMMRLI